MYGPGNKGEDSKVKTKEISAYIARYASHPAISETRIIDVDYEARKVTWYYDPHEDDGLEEENKKIGRQTITEDVFNFIMRLIVHIPDKNFHLIRYCGFYSNRTTRSIPAEELMEDESSIQKQQIALRWRNMIKQAFGSIRFYVPAGTS